MPLNIQYISDLHLELEASRRYFELYPIVPKTDILIIAGDLLGLNKDGSVDEIYLPFLSHLSKSFDNVFAIPGNHEYYNGFDLINSKKELRLELCPNVFLVNNTCEMINGVKFIFSTLWSKVHPEFICENFPDFTRCQYQNRPLTVDGYNSLHEHSRVFIENESRSDETLKVVVTHHLPSYSLIQDKSFTSYLAPAFASHSEDLIHKVNAHAWIYGHAHHKHQPPQKIGETKFYSNTFGYLK